MDKVPWLAIGLAWGVTTLLLWLGRPFALRVGWVDRPGPRKVHALPTPLIGGFAMFAGFVQGVQQLDSAWVAAEGLLLGGGMILIIGYLDDMHNMGVAIRVVLEAFLAWWLVVTCDLEIRSLGNLFGFGEVALGRWSVPFTVVSCVGLVNAINMSDGLDGLAAGQSLMAFLLMTLLALLGGHWPEAWVLSLFLAVVLAFLAFNIPLPGRGAALVFMGDAGSLFLGLGLFWFSVRLSQGSGAVLAPVTALWLLALPLVDLFSSIVRRVIGHRKLHEPDMEHMHHLFVSLGLSKPRVFWRMLGLTTLFGLAGVVAQLAGAPEAAVFYLLVGIFLLYCCCGLYFWRQSGSCVLSGAVKK